MKDTVLLLLCAVALAQATDHDPEQRSCNCDPSEAQQICHLNYGNDEILIAHENCDQFYKCANGKPVAFYCPNNLLYNPYAQTCDWPHNVECGNRPISEGPSQGADSDSGSDEDSDIDNDLTCNCNPGEAPSICAAEGSNGIFVAHENCNQFYQCAEGRPVSFSCSPTLLYNPYKRACDWPQNVECGDRVIPEPEEDNDSTTIGTENDGTCNCNPEEAPAICAAPDSESVLISHENCNMYYICNHGVPVATSCSGNLLFNPYTKQCDWPSNIDCGDRLVPEIECTGCNENTDDDTSCDDDDVSPKDDESPPVSDADAITKSPPGTCNCNPEEASSICAADDTNTVLVAHENCNQFYKCDHGKPVVLTCQEDLIYNPYTEQCDWPENVDCGDRVIPDPDDSNTTPGGTNPPDTTPGNNCDPSEAPALCAADNSDGVLVAHENCNQFYQCSGGKPEAHTCPLNLLFNPAKDQCDWPENVDCGDRVIPDPEASDSGSSEVTTPGVVVPTRPPGTCNCNPEEAPSICAADDSSGVLIAHENCNQFYTCDHGKPVVRTCHGDLLYNPYTEQCDWPENVNCGDRVIPDPDNTSTTPGGTNPDVTNQPGNNCDPSEAPALCAADNSEGVLVAHENCNQFYKCSGGKPEALTCPLNLLFNPAKDQCDWPENVDCGDRVIPDPEASDSGSSEVTPPGVVVPTRPPGTCNCNPGEAPAICAADNSSGILIAHENCNQFYTCDHGKPVVRICHGDLLYNPYTEQCDWPENVDCGDRVIPDPEASDSDSSDIQPPGDDVVVPTRPPGTCNCNPGEAPAICAADNSSGILIAHENCNQFYTCDHGKPVVRTCHGDLLYNPYTEQCDWPENVNCGDRVIPDPDNTSTTPRGTNPDVTNQPDTTPGNNCDPSEAPALCAADNSDGVLVAHENCNQFYQCSGGKPEALTCPPNLLFNPAKDQCDWPENVDCGDRVIPDPKASDSGSSEVTPPGVVVPTRPPGTCNCNPGEAPAICAADDSSGILIAHENCNQFYTCDHGKPVVRTCHGDLLYNPYTEQCDWPENVDCGDRVIPDPDNTSTTPGGTKPDVTNQPDTTPGNNCDPSEAPALCAADNSDGVLVAHENCNQFYQCSGGKPEALTCPHNLLFNPAKDQCDWPENVDCGDRVIPDPEASDSDSSDIQPPGDDVVVPTRPPGTCNCNPGEAPAICAADDSSGILIAHENCNQFYTCDHGKPVVRTCHGDLLYNPYTEQCDWPENVDCGDRVIPDPDNTSTTPGGTKPDVTNQPDTTPGNNCDPSEAPALCAADNSDGVLVAHENCNQFYQCSGGKPEALTCPHNLLFNPAKDQCDWPENVDCGDRVIPDPEASDSGSSEVTPPGVVVPTRPPGTCNCNPGEAPAICAADNSSGILIAHENCNQFYSCDHGKPIVHTCPGDLLYNPYTEQCDWPENVHCGDRVIPDPEDSDSDSSDIQPPGDDVVVPTRPPGTCNCNPGEAPAICAADNSSGILIAHENCNQFYTCDHGKPVVRTCHGDLLYNPYTEQCDWPENVDCGDRVIPDPDNTSTTPGGTKPDVTNQPDTTPGNNCDPSEAPALCAADNSDGVLVAHENCNQFYQCSGGKPEALTCPHNLLFNPAKDQCDWPENVDCGDRVIPDPEASDSGSSEVTPPGVVVPTRPPGTCNCNPGEAPAICAADNSSGILIAHENCNQFYSCDHGKPIVRTCPGDLLYNPYTEQCDWPENVDCGDRVIPDVSVTTPGVTNPTITTPAITAPTSTTPAVTTPVVTTPAVTVPAITTPAVTTPIVTTPAVTVPAVTTPGVTAPAVTTPVVTTPTVTAPAVTTPESDDDSPEIRPPGDDISPQPPIDDSNETEDCSNSGENGTCNCDPDQAPSICAVDNSDGVLIAHENCNQFYQCGNGVPTAFKCPSNTLYNPVLEVCDWPFNVDCGDRIIPDPEDNESENKEEESEEEEIVGPCNCNPEEAPAICAVDNSTGVKIAHQNCNQFYVCDHGSPVTFTCNGFLLYNPYTQHCDWPENVECGNRVIPDPVSDESDSDSNDDDNNIIVNDDPSQAPTICAGHGSDGVLVAHENCDKYYICSAGEPVSRPCSDGLLFNPNNGHCDWPSNVICGNRITPDQCACNYRNAPALCAKPGSDGKLVAHENCNQFYTCAHSVPVAQSCPASLLYNTDTELCDWPQNVKCENRILSRASLNKHWPSLRTLRE